MAEMELSTLRQRSHEARKLKASRGEYYSCVAVGYVRNERGGLDKDPDGRVREAIELIFRKFTELGSVRHHEGYVSWETFEHNQHMITHNATLSLLG